MPSLRCLVLLIQPILFACNLLIELIVYMSAILTLCQCIDDGPVWLIWPCVPPPPLPWTCVALCSPIVMCGPIGVVCTVSACAVVYLLVLVYNYVTASCTCNHTCTHTRAHTDTHTHTRAYVHTGTHVHIHTETHMDRRTDTHMYSTHSV